MNKLIARAALSIGILVFYPFAVALAATDVLFLLDASGSMREQLNGERKIDWPAQRSKLLLPRCLPLRRSPCECLVTALTKRQSRKLQRFRTCGAVCAQTDKLVGAVRSVSPLGYTPIAYSLEQSRGDFSVEREVDKVIILLSDGEETCGGDPKATITALINSGFKVKVHTIGFKVNSVAQKQLRDIAEVSGGEYFSAENAKDLGEALSEATRSALVIRKERVIYGETIRGGDSFETAVPLPLGKELRLDHVQKADFYDYFSFDANIGDDLSLVTRALDAALTVKDNGKTEQVDPKMAVQLLGPDRDQMRSSYVSGTFRRDEQKIQARKTGSHYLLVGSNSTLIPVEGGLFMVERKTYLEI